MESGSGTTLPGPHPIGRGLMLVIALLLGLLLALLLACTTADQPLPPDRRDSTIRDQPGADTLRLRLDVPADVPAGSVVRMQFTVTNISGRNLELYLTGREPTLDIVVRDGAAQVVWRSLQGVAVPSILQLRPLAAGDSLNLTRDWQPPRGARGEYHIEAALLSEAGPLPFPAAMLTIRP